MANETQGNSLESEPVMPPIEADLCLSEVSFRRIRCFPRSAWYGHAPFALWLVNALRPRRIVELGTYEGFSFFTFCQAVRDGQIPAELVAIDTWEGDEHAGVLAADAYRRIERIWRSEYADISRLMRCAFDEALEEFDDGSIDLLHIDGLHTYEAVRHDFECWLPKMRQGGVVLFHDTVERRDDFGVHRFWREVSEGRRSFDFLHGHGLGVLGIGQEFPPAVGALFVAAQDPGATFRTRQAYGRLGAAVEAQARIHILETKIAEARVQAAQVPSLETELQILREEINWLNRKSENTGWLLKRLGRQARHWPRDLSRRLQGKLRRQCGAESDGRHFWTPHSHLGLAEQVKSAARASVDRTTIALVEQEHRPAVLLLSGEKKTPGHIYRIEHHADALRAAGWSVSTLMMDDLDGHCDQAARIDLLMIWRARWSDKLGAFISRARWGGAKVLFDLDDLMVDPDIADAKFIDAIRLDNKDSRQVRKHYSLVKETMKNADLCTASTRELAWHMEYCWKMSSPRSREIFQPVSVTMCLAWRVPVPSKAQVKSTPVPVQAVTMASRYPR